MKAAGVPCVVVLIIFSVMWAWVWALNAAVDNKVFNIQPLVLVDGTKCVVIKDYRQAGISCNWKD